MPDIHLEVTKDSRVSKDIILRGVNARFTKNIQGIAALLSEVLPSGVSPVAVYTDRSTYLFGSVIEDLGSAIQNRGPDDPLYILHAAGCRSAFKANARYYTSDFGPDLALQNLTSTGTWVTKAKSALLRRQYLGYQVLRVLHAREEHRTCKAA